MARKPPKPRRREESLSRDRIIDATIELLDSTGEGGLTFRALSERLATGPGAIYWHVANKNDLLIAACDAIVERMLVSLAVGATPKATVRSLALGMFDAIDAHPWVGSALMWAAGQLPMVRILERLGQQVRALGVPTDEEWAAVSALLHYIMGVGAQHATNTHVARVQRADRSDFLDAVATAWSELDPDEYPFAHGAAGRLRDHDDRVDFLAGIDFILEGIHPARRR